MAIHVIEKLIEVVASVYGTRLDITLTSPRSNVMYVRSTVAGTIIQVSVYHAGNVTGGQAAWNLRKNGTSLFSGVSRPIVTAGNSSSTKSGLSFSTVVGDLFQLDLDELPSSGIPTPIVLLIFIDDGVAVPQYLDDLTDVVATAPSAGDIITWDAVTSKWIKSAIPASTFAGDVIGASNANTAVKIQNRQIKNWALPVTFGDNFNAGSLDTVKWDTHTSQSSWSQSGGNLVFTRLTGTASGHIFSRLAFDFTGKTVIVRLPAFVHATAGQTINIMFGVVSYSTNPTLYTGGTMPQNFVGMKLHSYNGGFGSQCMKQLSSGGVDVTSPYGDALAIQPNALIDSIRIRDNGTGTVFYEVAYQSAPTVWVTLDSQAYTTPVVLTNKMVMLQMDRDSAGTILTNAIESSIVSSDEIVDGDVVYWNAGTQQFESKTIATPNIATVSVTTASIANTIEATGTIALGKTFKIKHIVSDRYCRIRLYKTAAARTADAARAFGATTYLGTQHKIILDLLLDVTAGLNWELAPDVLGSNGDSPAVSNIYYAIQNLSGATSTVLASFDVVKEIV